MVGKDSRDLGVIASQDTVGLGYVLLLLQSDYDIVMALEG